MSEFLEIEFKNGLTEEQYNQLLSYFRVNPSQIIIQKNIYFDTKDLKLKQYHCVLRTRIKDNKIELTLKEPKENGLLETTDMITQFDLTNLLDHHILYQGEVAKKILNYNIKEPLSEIVSFTTYRYEIQYQNNLIAIDKSVLNEYIDYELELETNVYEEGKKVFEELLNKLNIPRIKTTSKAKRFFAYKMQEN